MELIWLMVLMEHKKRIDYLQKKNNRNFILFFCYLKNKFNIQLKQII